jgi:DNA repair protein RadA
MKRGPEARGEGTRTALDVLEDDPGFEVFSTGSNAVDGLLGGGYREGRVVEFFGKSNSGKTQLAMQAVYCAAMAGARALFVDTEGTFRPERVLEIAKARGWDETCMDRIVYLRSDSSREQMETVRRMEKREATRTCRVVVVDTLTRNFSVDLPGSRNLSHRQAALNLHLSEMARDAYLNHRAYVLTNRVTFGPTGDIGIGGRTVEQLVHLSVRLEREGSRLRVVSVPGGRAAEAAFGEGGVD